MNSTVTDRVRAGHRDLFDLVGALDTDTLRQPSRLPDWSRAHVLAHLAHNARALTRVTTHALRGELVDTYPDDDRDEAVDRDSSREAPELVQMLSASQEQLEAAWEDLSEDDWSRPVKHRDGTVHELLLCRWRENEVHALDLDLGRTEESWSPEFCEHAIDFLTPRLEGSDVTLAPDDIGRTWTFGTGESHLNGSCRTLACWMTGRTPRELPTSEAPLPELAPWP